MRKLWDIVSFLAIMILLALVIQGCWGKEKSDWQENGNYEFENKKAIEALEKRVAALEGIPTFKGDVEVVGTDTLLSIIEEFLKENNAPSEQVERNRRNINALQARVLDNEEWMSLIDGRVCRLIKECK